jgi:hypothetical protein
MSFGNITLRALIVLMCAAQVGFVLYAWSQVSPSEKDEILQIQISQPQE